MSNKIGNALRRRLDSAQPDDIFNVNVFINPHLPENKLNAVDWQPSYETSRVVTDEIKAQVSESQSNVLSYLNKISAAYGSVEKASHAVIKERFWINNSVNAEISRDVLEAVLKLDEVAFIELVLLAEMEELIDEDEIEADTGLTAEEARDLSQEIFQSSAAQRTFSTGSNAEAIALAPDMDASIPWNVSRINAPLLWEMGIKGEGIIVAIVDSGVDYNHPDLSNRMWDGGEEFPLHGFDFSASPDNDPMDEGVAQMSAGHGTGSAGLVAGDGTSGCRTGVAPEATLMALRVSAGEEIHHWRALQFAIDHGAHVINMSLTWKFNRQDQPDHPGWRRICQTLLAAGILHANSSGNNGLLPLEHPIPFNIGAPANCPPPWLHPLQNPRGGLSSVVACGSVNDKDQLAANSGHGPTAWNVGPFTDYPLDNMHGGLIKPDICAPGVRVLTCLIGFDGSPGGKPYRPGKGTSTAAPHVAGCFALLAQASIRSGRPIVPARIHEAVERTAQKIQGQTQDKENNFGTGRVDVYRAFEYGRERDWWA